MVAEQYKTEHEKICIPNAEVLRRLPDVVTGPFVSQFWGFASWSPDRGEVLVKVFHKLPKMSKETF